MRSAPRDGRLIRYIDEGEDTALTRGVLAVEAAERGQNRLSRHAEDSGRRAHGRRARKGMEFRWWARC